MVLSIINANTLRGFKSIGYFSFIRNAINNLFVCLLIGLIAIGSFQLELAMIYTIGVVIASIVSTFVVINKFTVLSENGHCDESRGTQFRSIFSVASPLFISSFSFMALNWSDALIIGYFCDDIDVGIYAIVVKYAGLVLIGIAAVNSIVAPKLSEYWAEGELVSISNVAQNSALLGFVISIPVILSLVLFPKFFLGLYGEDFIVGSRTLVIMVIGSAINVICGSVGYILMMTDRQRVYRNILLFAVVINLSLDFVLVPKYGILGAGIANAIGVVIWNLISAFYILVHFKFWPGLSIVSFRSVLK